MIADVPGGRRLDLLTLTDFVALAQEIAVRLDREADAAADRGDFARAAELRRQARGEARIAAFRERVDPLLPPRT